MSDEDWELNLAVNLTGTYNVTKAVFPGMRERRWGRVVCMASIAGLMGGFGQTAYATTKMGADRLRARRWRSRARATA